MFLQSKFMTLSLVDGEDEKSTAIVEGDDERAESKKEIGMGEKGWGKEG
jgi:hypothetical protein